MRAHEVFAFISWLKRSSQEQLSKEQRALRRRKDDSRTTRQGRNDLMLSLSFIDAELRLRSYFEKTRRPAC